MTPPTVWPARVVGDRILCGRMVDGRYVCQGELATVSRLATEQARLPAGVVIEDSIIGDDRIAHVRLTARAERQAADGRRPDGNAASPERYNDGSREVDYVQPRRGMRRWASLDAPFTRHCPHCRALGLVDFPLATAEIPE